MSQKGLLKPRSWVPLLLPDHQAPTRSPKREESVLARKPSEKHIHRNKPMGGSSAVRGLGEETEGPLPSNQGQMVTRERGWWLGPPPKGGHGI